MLLPDRRCRFDDTWCVHYEEICIFVRNTRQNRSLSVSPTDGSDIVGDIPYGFLVRAIKASAPDDVECSLSATSLNAMDLTSINLTGLGWSLRSASIYPGAEDTLLST